MNKKGGKYLSFWWLLILVIIGLAIAGGVIIFYSKNIDVKKMEAEILVGRLSDCLAGGGKLNQNLLNDDFNIFSECKLNEKILSDSEHYFRVNVEGDKKKKIESGNADIKTQCKIKEGGSEAKYFGECSSIALSVKDYKINIFAGSNQAGKKEVK